MSTVTPLVDHFLDYLRNERDASPHTLSNYRFDLQIWMRYLAEVHGRLGLHEMADLTRLRAFVAAQSEQFERSTVMRRLSVLKTFLKYLHREGHLDKNVAKLVSLPRPDDTLPRVLRPEQVTELIETVPVGKLSGKRLKAVLEMLYSTGIRVSELVGLSYGDLDLKAGFLTVQGKGNRQRVVPMGRHCQKALREYIDAMPPQHRGGPRAAVFVNRDGERVTVRTIQRTVREYAIHVLGSAGANVTPHTFRHSCATHLLSGGAGLRQIQELLGHRSLVATQKYTHVDRERLKASYDRAHPREKGSTEDKKDGDE